MGVQNTKSKPQTGKQNFLSRIHEKVRQVFALYSFQVFVIVLND